MADKIVLTHPATKGTTTVLANGSSRRVLERRGWTAATSDDPGPLEKRKRDELDAIAIDAGLDPSDFATKRDLAAAIAERVEAGNAAAETAVTDPGESDTND